MYAESSFIFICFLNFHGFNVPNIAKVVVFIPYIKAGIVLNLRKKSSLNNEILPPSATEGKPING